MLSLLTHAARRAYAPVRLQTTGNGLGGPTPSGEEPLCVRNAAFFMPWCALYGRTGRESRKALPVLGRSANPSGSAHHAWRRGVRFVERTRAHTMAIQSHGASAHVPASSANNSTHESAAAELRIDIYPRGYVSWRGSSEQLRDEGLIPPDFVWPSRNEPKCWTADGFDFILWRCRPEGIKVPRAVWWQGDHWFLRRTLHSHGLDGWAAARIYEKERELAFERWKQTREGFAQSARYFQARCDEAFQSFLVLAAGLHKRKRGRKAKAQQGGLQ